MKKQNNYQKKIKRIDFEEIKNSYELGVFI